MYTTAMHNLAKCTMIRSADQPQELTGWLSWTESNHLEARESPQVVAPLHDALPCCFAIRWHSVLHEPMLTPFSSNPGCIVVYCSGLKPSTSGWKLCCFSSNRRATCMLFHSSRLTITVEAPELRNTPMRNADDCNLLLAASQNQCVQPGAACGRQHSGKQ